MKIIKTASVLGKKTNVVENQFQVSNKRNLAIFKDSNFFKPKNSALFQSYLANKYEIKYAHFRHTHSTAENALSQEIKRTFLYTLYIKKSYQMLIAT